MNNIYILLCDVWDGTKYNTEVIRAFKDEETAYRTSLVYQGKYPIYDVKYYVETCEYDEIEP